MKCNYIKRGKYIKLKFSGRNNTGRITVRGKQKVFTGKKAYIYSGFNYLNFRLVKMFMFYFNVLKAKVVHKLNDPRKASVKCIILFSNSILNNCCSCYPGSEQLGVGKNIVIGNHKFLQHGNIISLHDTPVGARIHTVTTYKTGMPAGSRVLYIKTSKKNAYIVHIGPKYAVIKLPSGELKLINKNSYCIFGELELHRRVQVKKAGKARQLGFRPKVRGVAMNACDHPHGGGEGKSSIGRKRVFSIWGKACKGVRTKKLNKCSLGK